MKKTAYIPFIFSLAGIMILLIALWLGSAWINLIAHGFVLTGLLITGITTILLQNSGRTIKFIAAFCAWAGFLVWTLAIYHFLELRICWNIGFSLMSLGLIAGIYRYASVPAVKWILIVTGVLVLAFTCGILFKVEKPVFYTVGFIGLCAFSLAALAGTIIVRPKSTPE